MGIYVRSTQLAFIIQNKYRRALGNSKLEVEILAAPRRNPTRLNITQYTFNPQSDTLVISGLKSNAVYNVRFFMMRGSTNSQRRYFVNTFIKTGMTLVAALCLTMCIYCPRSYTSLHKDSAIVSNSIRLE